MSASSKIRSRLLIVDCCVVIEAYRLGIWHAVVNQATVLVPETVLNETVLVAREFDEFSVDIEALAGTGKIAVPSMTVSQLAAVRLKCGPKFMGAVHDGELECLATLLADVSGSAMLCSSDAVVFRYLGWTQMPDSGVSLQEVAKSLGIAGATKMQWKLTKAFRERYTQQGFAEAVQSGSIRLST